MAINAYEESVILLQYLVKSESGNAAEIAVMYQDYLLNGEIASELIECSISSEKNTYVKETNENSFSVRIRGKMRRNAKSWLKLYSLGWMLIHRSWRRISRHSACSFFHRVRM